MHLWLKVTLCAFAAILLAWGVVRSLARSAPITADWGGLGFVAAALALMVLGIATTCVCILRNPSRPRSSHHDS